MNARGGRGAARGRGGRPAVRPTLPSNLMDEVHATYGESIPRAWIDEIHTDICQARVVPRSVGRTCGKPVDKKDPFLHRRALSEL